jgi:YidC/Oxa1 family membrane protein insertase
MLLSPLTYKNYLSSAKTRVLKPEIDELNAKFKDGDAMKKQQATMSLYRQAGVNPMAGCVPMILQFPILIAMYRFFPASIELRQESFLWADDLSSYDSIFDLGFSIPFYGDHVSLFTILMAISTMLYTKYNSQTATMGGGMQAQQMKIMMYIMPIFFLGFFNNFSAGLSYYYFLANVISMVQQWVIKKFFIDEDAIHRKIQENKKKPKAQKKSKFQQRLEDMAKQRGYNLPKK